MEEIRVEYQKCAKIAIYRTRSPIEFQALGCKVPMKTKYVRGNNAPFMNKTLSKGFMLRAQLKNKFNKCPNGENKRLYNKK